MKKMRKFFVDLFQKLGIMDAMSIASRISEASDVESKLKRLRSEMETEVRNLKKLGLDDIAWFYSSMVQNTEAQLTTVERIKKELEKLKAI